MTDLKTLLEKAKRLAALKEGATPGPWEHTGAGEIYGMKVEKLVLACAPRGDLFWVSMNRDPDLAAAAPEMAEVIEELVAKIDTLTRLVDAMEDKTPAMESEEGR